MSSPKRFAPDEIRRMYHLSVRHIDAASTSQEKSKWIITSSYHGSHHRAYHFVGMRWQDETSILLLLELPIVTLLRKRNIGG